MISAYNEGLLTPRRYYEILIHEVRVSMAKTCVVLVEEKEEEKEKGE